MNPAKLYFLIDTSAWIEYLNKTSHPISKEIESALLLNTAVTSQIILAELLQGAKSEKEVDLILDLPSVVKILEDGPSTWQEAGLLANKLRKEGKTLPLIDCFLAVLAQEHKASILSLDKHFKLLANHVKI